MARTTEAAVQSLLSTGGDYDANTSPSLTAFVDTATLIIDRVKALAIVRDDPLTDAELELVERWLAAWAYCQSDQPYSSKGEGGANGSFQGQTGMYLEANKYGQTALVLDHSGALSALTSGGGRNTASTFWGGRTPRNQTPYDFR
jgi:hypothetical protein